MKLALALSIPTVLLGGSALAQDTVPAAPFVGMVDNPCPDLPPVPPSVQEFAEAFVRPGPANLPVLLALTQQPDFKAYSDAKKAREAQDWPGLCAYRSDNMQLIASGVRPDVVFLGDSITENWARADPQFMDGVRIIGRGIGGQTSGQMLGRFRADVVALHPRVVHIMAGTNDVAGNGGPTSPQAYQNNIMSMVDLARANGIAVVLASLPPADHVFWQPAARPAARIIELNAWLKAYAAENGLRFVDYYPGLVNATGGLKAEYGFDGVHPNRDGYAAMRDAALAALK